MYETPKFGLLAPYGELGEEYYPPQCEGCGGDAALTVNGHAVCPNCVDLASEDGEDPVVEDL